MTTKIYIALVDTPGLLAAMIRLVLKQRYIHVVLSMDDALDEAYSVGRRNPYIPYFAGFERERKEQVLGAFPTARYMVYEIACTPEQKARIRKALQEAWRGRFHYHYAVLGLFFILLGRPFYQKGHYTCSSYIAKLLSENGIGISKKHFSLVTPKDFLQYPHKRVVYEGSLAHFVQEKEAAKARMGRLGSGEALYG